MTAVVQQMYLLRSPSLVLGPVPGPIEPGLFGAGVEGEIGESAADEAGNTVPSSF